MSECSCAEMGEALRRLEQRIAELDAENAALRADARLGAMVRRLPEMLDEERGPDSVAAALLRVHRDFGWVVEEHDAWGGGVKDYCHQPPEGGLYVPIRDPLEALAACPATPVAGLAGYVDVRVPCDVWQRVKEAGE